MFAIFHQAVLSVVSLNGLIMPPSIERCACIYELNKSIINQETNSDFIFRDHFILAELSKLLPINCLHLSPPPGILGLNQSLGMRDSYHKLSLISVFPKDYALLTNNN